MTARPTTLKLYTDACPYAVTLYEQGAHHLKGDTFAPGTAFHDIVHAMSEGRDVQSVIQHLVTIGRVGIDAEGPLPFDAVAEGHRLARHWMRDRVMPEVSWYELGLAFSTDFAARMPYEDAEAWVHCKIDRVSVIDDVDGFEQPIRVLEVADYKLSWQADEAELDTIQRKVQAVSAWHAIADLVGEGEIDAIDLVIHSVRTGSDYRRRLWLPDDVATLEAWQTEVATLVTAHDHKPRTARPGPACISCDYAADCEASLLLLHAFDGDPKGQHASDDELATAWAVAKSHLNVVTEVLQHRIGKREKVVLPDGSAVGYVARPKTVMTKGHASLMADAFTRGQDMGPHLFIAMVDAMGGLTVTQARKLARHLHKGNVAAQEALLAQWTEAKVQGRWDSDKPGTHPVEVPDVG